MSQGWSLTSSPCTGGWWAPPLLWSVLSFVPEVSQESHYHYCQRWWHADLQEKDVDDSTKGAHDLNCTYSPMFFTRMKSSTCSLTVQGGAEVHSLTRTIPPLQLITCGWSGTGDWGDSKRKSDRISELRLHFVRWRGKSHQCSLCIWLWWLKTFIPVQMCHTHKLNISQWL